MLSVTDKAVEMMTEALRLEEKQDHGLRLVAQTGCCSGPQYGLFPENEFRPDDTVVTEGELKIIIDPTSMTILEGATIDFINDPEMGQGFTIKDANYEAPEGSGSCGCNSEGAEAQAQAESECACGGSCSCNN